MDNPHACLQCNRYLHRIRELEAALRDAQNRLLQVTEPWLGARADIIPAAVAAIVPLLNEWQSLLRSPLSDETLDRHGAFRDAAVTLVRDMRLALLRGDYLIKQQMDARSDAWLKEVDGPRPTRSPSRPDNLSIGPSLSDTGKP